MLHAWAGLASATSFGAGGHLLFLPLLCCLQELVWRRAVCVLVRRERMEQQKQRLEGLQGQADKARAQLAEQAAKLTSVETRLAQLAALQKVGWTVWAEMCSADGLVGRVGLVAARHAATSCPAVVCGLAASAVL